MNSKLNYILLIDDDPINNYLNQRILKRLSLAKKIDIAGNGEEGLKKIENAYCDNGCGPELIFLDLNMPVMNGFEFLQIYRDQKISEKSNSKIIVLTSSSDLNDKDMVKKLGLEHYSKPLTEEMAYQVLASISNESSVGY